MFCATEGRCRFPTEGRAPVPRFPTKHAVSDGLRIAYSDAGAGPAIVFLHGVGSLREVWDDQLRALSDRFRCIAVEYRGYGESDVPPLKSLASSCLDRRSISRAAFARDAFAVMDAAGVNRAHFCGLSLGGVVAFEAFARQPARVASLALADSFAHYPRGVQTMRERLSVLRELGMERFAAARAAGILRPSAPRRLIERSRAHMESIPLSVYLAATRATWTGDYRPLLPKIAVPVIVLWGEHDHTVTPRGLSQEISAGAPDCRGFVVIENAGHVANVDNPAAFNRALANFLDSIA